MTRVSSRCAICIRGEDIVGRDRPWQKLVHVPTNRYDAWRQISPLLQKAGGTDHVAPANDIFVAYFGVALHELTTMFENKNWRHAKAYGGNAWAEITKTTLALGDALSADDQELATSDRVEVGSRVQAT